MTFGQPAGPPAGQRQIDRLLELLADRGFDSFREARHRLNLTQRQANGRFTAPEAEELIERLEAGVQVEQSRFGNPPARTSMKTQDARGSSDDGEGHAVDDDPVPGVGVTEAFLKRAAQVRRREYAREMLDIPDEALADELVSRGWCCIPPPVD